MNIPHNTQWEDYGLGGVDYVEDNQEPEDWRLYGIPNYGAYADQMGIMSADEIEMPLVAEVDQGLYGNQVLARAPLLELAPRDFKWMKTMKRPYANMMALGDDGMMYEYDDQLGFFKKLFRRAKKKIKKISRRVRKGIRKVIKKIPGGKYVLKLGKKIWKIAHKLVKPLTKFVGKYAAKLAPIAALIPGYGPAIAAALYTAGKVANLMNKYGVKIKGAAGKVRKLAFPSGKNAKRFQKAMKKQAKKAQRKRKKMGGKKYAMMVKSGMKRMGRGRRGRRR